MTNSDLYSFAATIPQNVWQDRVLILAMHFDIATFVNIVNTSNSSTCTLEKYCALAPKQDLQSRDFVCNTQDEIEQWVKARRLKVKDYLIIKLKSYRSHDELLFDGSITCLCYLVGLLGLNNTPVQYHHIKSQIVSSSEPLRRENDLTTFSLAGYCVEALSMRSNSTDLALHSSFCKLFHSDRRFGCCRTISIMDYGDKRQVLLTVISRFAFLSSFVFWLSSRAVRNRRV